MESAGPIEDPFDHLDRDHKQRKSSYQALEELRATPPFVKSWRATRGYDQWR